MNLFIKQKDAQTQKTNICLLKGKVGRGINWGFGLNRYTLLYIKWINNTAQGTISNIL